MQVKAHWELWGRHDGTVRASGLGVSFPDPSDLADALEQGCVTAVDPGKAIPVTAVASGSGAALVEALLEGEPLPPWKPRVFQAHEAAYWNKL